MTEATPGTAPLDPTRFQSLDASRKLELIGTLAGSHVDDYREGLRRLLREESDPLILSALLCAVVRLGGNEERETLRPYLESDDALLRLHALECSELLGTAELYPEVVRLSEDDSPEIRKKAWNVLAKGDRRVVEEAFREVLRRESEESARAVLACLENLPEDPTDFLLGAFEELSRLGQVDEVAALLKKRGWLGAGQWKKLEALSEGGQEEAVEKICEVLGVPAPMVKVEIEEDGDGSGDTTEGGASVGKAVLEHSLGEALLELWARGDQMPAAVNEACEKIRIATQKEAELESRVAELKEQDLDTKTFWDKARAEMGKYGGLAKAHFDRKTAASGVRREVTALGLWAGDHAEELAHLEAAQKPLKALISRIEEDQQRRAEAAESGDSSSSIVKLFESTTSRASEALPDVARERLGLRKARRELAALQSEVENEEYLLGQLVAEYLETGDPVGGLTREPVRLILDDISSSEARCGDLRRQRSSESSDSQEVGSGGDATPETKDVYSAESSVSTDPANFSGPGAPSNLTEGEIAGSGDDSVSGPPAVKNLAATGGKAYQFGRGLEGAVGQAARFLSQLGRRAGAAYQLEKEQINLRGLRKRLKVAYRDLGRAAYRLSIEKELPTAELQESADKVKDHRHRQAMRDTELKEWSRKLERPEYSAMDDRRRRATEQRTRFEEQLLEAHGAHMMIASVTPDAGVSIDQLVPAVERGGGRVLWKIGDALAAIFTDPGEAIHTSTDLHLSARERSSSEDKASGLGMQIVPNAGRVSVNDPGDSSESPSSGWSPNKRILLSSAVFDFFDRDTLPHEAITPQKLRHGSEDLEILEIYC